MHFINVQWTFAFSTQQNFTLFKAKLKSHLDPKDGTVQLNLTLV